MTPDEVLEVLRSPAAVARNPFSLLRGLANAAASDDDERTQELLLRALEHRSHFGGAAQVLDDLVRQVGLFPYLDPEQLSLRDRIAHEFHKPENMDPGIVFHRVQAEVYRLLMDGVNVVLSAPTSFGKSLLIDAVVASGKYKNMAIVVPTVALIDETRRRLTSSFRETYKIITHPSQSRAAKNIFVITQERLQDFEQLGDIEFFVIDEFYKLNPDPDPANQGRSVTLNHAFYRLLKTGARFYLLGPNIEDIPSGFEEQYGCVFFRTDYKTVAAETIKVTPSKPEEEALVSLCKGLADPTLIFCSSPGRTRKVAQWLLDAGIGSESPKLAGAASWIGKEYHPDWLFGRALGQGIGIHHSRIPRALAQYVVRAFNADQSSLRFLICTSTLIEGVNTKAKNIVILDNTIVRKKIDFFTFNNVRGRAGRMFKHFVGKIFLFHEPPKPGLPSVDIPMYSQGESAPDSLLMQLDSADLSDDAKERVQEYESQDVLALSVLRDNAGIDPKAQLALARHLKANAPALLPFLSWKSFPSYDQLKVCTGLIWDFLRGDIKTGESVKSASQLTMKISNLRKKTIRQLIDDDLKSPYNATRNPDEIVEGVFDFLRTWAMFHFPRLLMALGGIQAGILGQRAGDYRFFASRIENLYLDPALFALDEYGVPWQTAKRLEPLLKPEGSLDTALAKLAKLDVARAPLSEFERELVNEARRYL